MCLDYRREAVCALAGPAANFIVSLAALPFARWYLNALKLAAHECGYRRFQSPARRADGRRGGAQKLAAAQI